MKSNGENPAHPLHANVAGLNSTGLTKREHLAACAMQGLLASNIPTESECVYDITTLCQQAVCHADMLLHQLATIDPPAAKGAEPESSEQAGCSADGVGLIRIERDRQKRVEGWTPEHDAEHVNGELAEAACLYARVAVCQAEWSPGAVPEPHEYAHDSWVGLRWPFEPESYKPSPVAIRNLQKAGALIAAEIDRLQMLEASDG